MVTQEGQYTLLSPGMLPTAALSCKVRALNGPEKMHRNRGNMALEDWRPAICTLELENDAQVVDVFRQRRIHFCRIA
jgi:hypothetical protein